MPLVDKFYKRMLNFVHRCLASESMLVNFIARHGILHGQTNSVVGRNVLNCSLRYNSTCDDIFNLIFSPHDIDKHSAATADNSIIVALLIELLQCRDGELCLSGEDFNASDVASMNDRLFMHELTILYILFVCRHLFCC